EASEGWFRAFWGPRPAAVAASSETRPLFLLSPAAAPTAHPPFGPVALVAAGQQYGADTWDRMGSRLGEQGRPCFLPIFAGARHPRGDQPRHDRGGEGRAAPLAHTVEIPHLIFVF